jgi:hypothetical protein
MWFCVPYCRLFFYYRRYPKFIACGIYINFCMLDVSKWCVPNCLYIDNSDIAIITRVFDENTEDLSWASWISRFKRNRRIYKFSFQALGLEDIKLLSKLCTVIIDSREFSWEPDSDTARRISIKKNLVNLGKFNHPRTEYLPSRRGDQLQLNILYYNYHSQLFMKYPRKDFSESSPSSEMKPVTVKL